MPAFGVSQGSVEDLRQVFSLSNSHFLCVQLRCNNVGCRWGFWFSSNRQAAVLPGSVSVPRGPPGMALLGTWSQCCCLNCLPPLLADEGLVGRGCSFPCVLFSAYCIGSLWGIMPGGWPSARHSLLSSVPSHSFFPLTLWIDHSVQGLVAVGQALLLQLFIHQAWNKTATQFQGWIWFSFCCGETTAR